MRLFLYVLGWLVLLAGTGLTIAPLLFVDSINHPDKTRAMILAGFLVVVAGGICLALANSRNDEWLHQRLIADLEEAGQWVHRASFVGGCRRKYGRQRVEKALNELVASRQLVQQQMLFPERSGAAKVLGIAHPKSVGEATSN